MSKENESIQNGVKDKKLPHVLLVEDNLIALRIAETLAEKAGCTFTTASDGESALALVKTMDFDLIITDVGLPGISGKELVQFIREWEIASQKKKVPIIGLTAHSLGEAESQCLQAGMDKVLIKPLYLHTMQKLVKQFIPDEEKSEQKEGLRANLPPIEAELFKLEDFLLLNSEAGIKNVGSIETLKSLLRLLVSRAIPEDLAAIQQAYAEKNWVQIENLAHKMKSGAIYCGTIKMQMACQYVERYYKAGHKKLLEALYQQLIQVVLETKEAVQKWLESNS